MRISEKQAIQLFRAAKRNYRETPTPARTEALFRALNEIEPGFDLVKASERKG